jgi:rhodopsin domain-containing protein
MLFLFIPFFMLKGRGVNNRLKLYIYGIFGLGVLASVANFIRLAALVKLKKSEDPLFDAAPVFLWSALEVSIGISVAGIIELRPLMKKWGVKGFEDNFDIMDEDMQPIKLQTMDKSTIGFPIQVEEVGYARGPSVRGGAPKY